jgi:hypothetical protein
VLFSGPRRIRSSSKESCVATIVGKSRKKTMPKSRSSIASRDVVTICTIRGWYLIYQHGGYCLLAVQGLVAKGLRQGAEAAVSFHRSLETKEDDKGHNVKTDLALCLSAGAACRRVGARKKAFYARSSMRFHPIWPTRFAGEVTLSNSPEKATLDCAQHGRNRKRLSWMCSKSA